MGLHGITQFVNTLNGGIGSGIKANGVVCADDIVINSSGNANNIDTVLRQSTRTAEGTVTTDCNNSVKS